MGAVAAQWGEVLDESATGYWNESRAPLASLAFITPWLLVYELGAWQLGSGTFRNGADLWLRAGLDLLGFGQYLLLPSLTLGVLVAWHHTTGGRWRVSPRVLWGMLAESLLLGICLLLVARLQGALFVGLAGGELVAAMDRAAETAGRLIAFLGAGIYEEVLFRLMLLPAVVALLVALGLSSAASLWTAVVLTSLLFAAAHYVGPHGDSWMWFSFVFRFLAGAFFATLFVYRGFGITAGAHAAYDILVVNG